MKKALNKTAVTNYLIVNYILLLIFIIGVLFLIFSPVELACYYKDTYGIECPTCGLTRDFKSILNLNNSDLILPSSLYFFGCFSLIFGSRLIATILILRKANLMGLIIFEALVIASVITLLILARI